MNYSATNLSHINYTPQYKYLDLSYKNFDSTDTVKNRPLVFTDVRDAPVIQNARDYKLSIIRFQVDTFLSLPVLFFEVQRNQADINLGAYSVTLEYDDGVGGITITNPVYLQWIPQNLDEPEPAAPNTNPLGVQAIEPYYWCYNFEYFIDLVNTALTTAMNDLKAAVAPTLDTVEEPFLVWEPEAVKARLYARESHFDTTQFPQVKIYFNRPLFALFNSFNAINYNTSLSNNRQHQIIVDPYNGVKVTTLPNFTIDQVIHVDQTVSTIANWSPVSSVVFTSSTLPVEINDLSVPTVFIDGKQRNATGTYNLGQNIISDLSTDEFCYQSNLLYNPSAQYRYISLFNSQPIKDVNIEVYWRDFLGFLRPFYLPPNSSGSIKLLFEKVPKNERT